MTMLAKPKIDYRPPDIGEVLKENSGKVLDFPRQSEEVGRVALWPATNYDDAVCWGIGCIEVPEQASNVIPIDRQKS